MSQIDEDAIWRKAFKLSRQQPDLRRNWYLYAKHLLEHGEEPDPKEEEPPHAHGSVAAPAPAPSMVPQETQPPVAPTPISSLSTVSPQPNPKEDSTTPPRWRLEPLILPLAAVLMASVLIPPLLRQGQQQTELRQQQSVMQQEMQQVMEQMEQERDFQSEIQQELTQMQEMMEKVEAENEQIQSLMDYKDDISALIATDQLGVDDAETPSSRSVAAARTRSLLRTLDPAGKGSVIDFLYSVQLIQDRDRVISLSNADLTGADLHNLELSGASLALADLRESDLSETRLRRANLSGADLRGADLRQADLRFADLSGARYDDQTQFPETFDPETAGLILEQ